MNASLIPETKKKNFKHATTPLKDDLKLGPSTFGAVDCTVVISTGVYLALCIICPIYRSRPPQAWPPTLCMVSLSVGVGRAVNYAVILSRLLLFRLRSLVCDGFVGG